tara:strand:- start:143 stop:337 length:195 start_codon:yes stop_codon:yes gene_type:complete
MTNKDRTNKVKRLLGLQEKDTPNEYYRVSDVLCDLRHYCTIHNIDFEEENQLAEYCYDKEVKDE